MIPYRVPGVSHSRLPATPLRASSSDTPRRVNHGGAAWLRRRDVELRQPQDGAPVAHSTTDSIRFQEAEDAQITGATRSLGRRLLGLNVAARVAAEALPGPSALRQLLPKGPFLSKATLLKA